MLYTMDKSSYGKFNRRIKELKNKFKFSKVKQVLKDPKVISYLYLTKLKELHVLLKESGF